MQCKIIIVQESCAFWSRCQSHKSQMTFLLHWTLYTRWWWVITDRGNDMSPRLLFTMCASMFSDRKSSVFTDLSVLCHSSIIENEPRRPRSGIAGISNCFWESFVWRKRIGKSLNGMADWKVSLEIFWKFYPKVIVTIVGIGISSTTLLLTHTNTHIQTHVSTLFIYSIFVNPKRP